MGRDLGREPEGWGDAWRAGEMGRGLGRQGEGGQFCAGD